MSRWSSLGILMSLLVLASGCERKQTIELPSVKVPATRPLQAIGPDKAQPKLPTLKLWIGPLEMEAEIAATGPSVQTGMMFRTNLAENAGMLFVFPYAHQAAFWMKNTLVPLSIAYINRGGKILEIHDLHPLNTNSVLSQTSDIQFALEVNQGWFGKNNIAPGTLIKTERGSLEETFLRRNR